MKRFGFMLAAAVCCAALYAGCAKGGDDVKIGFVGPLSGDVAVYGVDCLNGARLAVDEVNASGGVLGKQIVLVAEDDEGNPEKTVNVYTLLTTRDGIGLMIGSLTSGCTIAITSKAQDQGVLLIAPAATNPKVTDAGDYIFRACFIDPFQGTVGGLFAARDLGSRRAAVIFDNGNDYSVGLKDNFVLAFAGNGGALVGEEAYITGDKDFNAQITKIRSVNPDVVYIPDYYSTVALIAKQLRAQGVDTPIVGADGWDGLTENAGDEVLNGFYSNHYAADSDNPRVVAFVSGYKAKYGGSVPTSFGALGYDSVYLMRDAIAAAGGTDAAAVKTALAATDGDYMTGRYTFDAHRDPIKSAVIVELAKGEDGKLVTRYKTTVNP
ncbi:MAG: ABC transporter substrate-binding protein [Spirochaetaceae bacterium]|nr:ABC transporter substrate-binding protein [Spirochaetaceae bacterium]